MATQTSFTSSLKRAVNAMPRAIRFPYGEQAFGLTTYSSIPKYGKPAVQSFADRLEAQLNASNASATAQICE